MALLEKLHGRATCLAMGSCSLKSLLGRDPQMLYLSVNWASGIGSIRHFLKGLSRSWMVVFSLMMLLLPAAWMAFFTLFAWAYSELFFSQGTVFSSHNISVSVKFQHQRTGCCGSDGAGFALLGWLAGPKNDNEGCGGDTKEGQEGLHQDGRNEAKCYPAPSGDRLVIAYEEWARWYVLCLQRELN